MIISHLKIKSLCLFLVVLALNSFTIAQQWETLGTSFSNGQALSPSISIYNGVPYVAYSEMNTPGTMLRASVKKYTGTGWVNVGNPGFSAWRANDVSLDFDRNLGVPYVAYQDVANGSKTTVKKFDGTNWVDVGNPGFSGGANASEQCIKIDPNGVPYVAMRYRGTSSSAPYQLKVMKYNGTSWSHVGTGVVPGVTGATDVSMAIDNGDIYVTCLNASQSNATSVFKFDGNTWSTVGSIAVSVASADNQSLAVYNGVPYVAYRDLGNNSKTTVRMYNGTNWVNVGGAGFSANPAQFQSIIITDNGVPYVAYSDNSSLGSGGQTTVMMYDGVNWVNVGSPSFTTTNSAFQSLAFDGGIPYVAYMDGSSLRATVKAYLPCTVAIPDANLNQAILSDSTINSNNNLFIECTEASAYTGTLFLGSLGVNDATGVEAFTNATELQIQGNNLSTLDVSANTSLESINCNANSLTNLVIGSNSVLENLQAGTNSLTTLDVSGATNLNTLNISNIPTLTGVDLTANTALQNFDCTSSSSIGGIGLIKTIDFSQNTQLKNLTVEYCAFNSLDVSNNTSLESLNCSNNNLEYLNVANGNNAAMGNLLNLALDARNNNNLTCIQIDNGFGPTLPNWQKDATAAYSTICSPICFVDIPDANFKAYLVGNTAINTNGDTEIQCAEASVFTGTISCSAQNISDLTGIEAFTNITNLIVNHNQLTSLDVSSNLALTSLSCQSNAISSININGLTNLSSFYCNNNQLTAIDLSTNSSLWYFQIESNLLTSLDVSNNNSLGVLRCQSNQLQSLTTTGAYSLYEIRCGFNNIVALDLSTNSSLNYLECNNNDLASLNMANGNNLSMPNNNFHALNNANLSCVQVDDVAYSTSNWMNIDGTVSFSSTPCTVLVTSIAVQGQNGVTNIAVPAGTLQMEATVLPTNATDGSYTWSVINNTGSATINSNGLLSAITNGTVDVVAQANDASGVTGTTTITITNQPVGIKKEASLVIKVYPNPVGNQLYINSDRNDILDLNIYDLSGKLVKSKVDLDRNLKCIQTSDLIQGIYILNIITNSEVLSIQFIKE